mgnify:CR=1 FL=1
MKHIVIVGSGIFGMTIAYWLKKKHPKYHIRILEKESKLGVHASGRNSGVLHAGFYYSPDSLKAKYCREGHDYLKDYVKKNKLKINECGKLIVTQSESDLDYLHFLKERGKVNQIPLELKNETETHAIDPNARTVKQALFSPKTATINPAELLHCLYLNLKQENVHFEFNQHYLSFSDKKVKTKNRTFQADFLINAAGTYAIDIAKQEGLGNSYTLLPFKGLYLHYDGPDQPIQTNIYPVPDKRNPFLGVHYTLSVENKVKIGPTATPAFWNEHYHGFTNFKAKECLKTLYYFSRLFWKNTDHFRTLAIHEVKKQSQSQLAYLASHLLHKIDSSQFKTWGKPGIRAQVLDRKSLKLLEDFVVERNENSMHLINAVSPGLTASFALSKDLVSQLD